MESRDKDRAALTRMFAEHGIDIEELQQQSKEKVQAFERLRPLIDAAIAEEEEGRREHR